MARQLYKAATCTHTEKNCLACDSVMRMRHLSVTLSVEFADADTAQKAHYQPDTDNRSDNRCTTTGNLFRKLTWEVLFIVELTAQKQPCAGKLILQL